MPPSRLTLPKPDQVLEDEERALRNLLHAFARLEEVTPELIRFAGWLARDWPPVDEADA